MIASVAFQGAGCAISKASASLMTEAVKGKTVEEARKHFAEFQQMLAKGDAAKHEETLGNLCALGSVHKFPMRVKCAVLSWHALMAGWEAGRFRRKQSEVVCASPNGIDIFRFFCLSVSKSAGNCVRVGGRKSR